MSDNKKSGWKNFFSLGEVGGYFFRSKEKNRTDNVNLKMMHGINKISIVMFLIGVIYLVVKNLF
ncbi:hypothetical protein OKW21_002450 [Catalinimonas alkaloidigena]|uniref:DUF6728 family protein n=1 Tax=Catalinimonas alkaloidigena TaxID=1075417 RepID=UPI0024053082|nr:DUF6728 family protein [Catalinimonas alkaloidigena]MDF9797187.1 hypothetical protein [Catalinimonas alkaloidigena]